MTNQEALKSVEIICDLMKDTIWSSSYNWFGLLRFDFTSYTRLSCEITPIEDKYKIKIYKTINIATEEVLYETDNVSGEDLYSTFHKAVNYLDEEWKAWIKGKKSFGWYGYTASKALQKEVK
jgi:hypothetical protein